MQDAFGVDLVQAHQQVASYHLDLAKIKSASPSNKVLQQIGRSDWQLDLLIFLNLILDSFTLLLLTLLSNFAQEGATYLACGLLIQKEEHVVRFVHVLYLAHVD